MVAAELLFPFAQRPSAPTELCLLPVPVGKARPRWILVIPKRPRARSPAWVRPVGGEAGGGGGALVRRKEARGGGWGGWAAKSHGGGGVAGPARSAAQAPLSPGLGACRPRKPQCGRGLGPGQRCSWWR